LIELEKFLDKLSYDDLIGKYLSPDWIKPEAGQKVKICHFLSHTSGLGSYFNDKLGRIVGHSGGFVGINSSLDMYLDSGYMVVVLSNYSYGSQAVNQKIRELLLRLKK